MRDFFRLSARTISASVGALALGACGGSGEPSSMELCVTRLNQHGSLTDRQQLYAIQTPAAWTDVGQVHEPQTRPAASSPKVDVSRQMVLGVMLGSDSNGCHSLRVVRVLQTDSQFQVQHVRGVPTATAVCTLAMVSLTDYVLVNRNGLPVVFSQVTS